MRWCQWKNCLQWIVICQWCVYHCLCIVVVYCISYSTIIISFMSNSFIIIFVFHFGRSFHLVPYKVATWHSTAAYNTIYNCLTTLGSLSNKLNHCTYETYTIDINQVLVSVKCIDFMCKTYILWYISTIWRLFIGSFLWFPPKATTILNMTTIKGYNFVVRWRIWKYLLGLVCSAKTSFNT